MEGATHFIQVWKGFKEDTRQTEVAPINLLEAINYGTGLLDIKIIAIFHIKPKS